MRKSILLAACLFVSAAQSAHAVQLKDCSQGALEKRVACLQENIVLLNSSHEAVAAELRKAVAALATKQELKQVKDDLTKQVNDTKGQIPKLDRIVIQWFDHPNSCLTYQGNNLLQVVDTCLDPNRNRFAIRPAP